MPPGVVTVTCTVPAPAGAVAVIEVAVSALTIAGFDPKSTALAAARLVPEMVTTVPPDAGPVTGLTPVTAGAAA